MFPLEELEPLAHQNSISASPGCPRQNPRHKSQKRQSLTSIPPVQSSSPTLTPPFPQSSTRPIPGPCPPPLKTWKPGGSLRSLKVPFAKFSPVQGHPWALRAPVERPARRVCRRCFLLSLLSLCGRRRTEAVVGLSMQWFMGVHMAIADALRQGGSKEGVCGPRAQALQLPKPPVYNSSPNQSQP